jgi:hypothetical protein
LCLCLSASAAHAGRTPRTRRWLCARTHAPTRTNTHAQKLGGKTLSNYTSIGIGVRRTLLWVLIMRGLQIGSVSCNCAGYRPTPGINAAQPFKQSNQSPPPRSVHQSAYGGTRQIQNAPWARVALSWVTGSLRVPGVLSHAFHEPANRAEADANIFGKYKTTKLTKVLSESEPDVYLPCRCLHSGGTDGTSLSKVLKGRAASGSVD